MPTQTQYPEVLEIINKRFARQGILFIPDHMFLCGQRRWEFDIAVICCKLAIEIEGFGHQKSNRFIRDMEKYNRLAIEGWRLLRFTPSQVNAKTPKFLTKIEDYFIVNPCTHQNFNQIVKNLRDG
jgi:hypothetical protein